MIIIWRPLSLLIVHESVTLRFCFKNFDFIFLSFYFFSIMQCGFCEKHLSDIKAKISDRFKFCGCSICILLCYTCLIELYILDNEPPCHVIKRTWRVVFLILLRIEFFNYCTSRWIIFQVNIASVCERVLQVIKYFYFSSFLIFF